MDCNLKQGLLTECGILNSLETVKGFWTCNKQKLIPVKWILRHLWQCMPRLPPGELVCGYGHTVGILNTLHCCQQCSAPPLGSDAAGGQQFQPFYCMPFLFLFLFFLLQKDNSLLVSGLCISASSWFCLPNVSSVRKAVAPALVSSCLWLGCESQHEKQIAC